MPTSYTDQFYIIDPYSPPPNGTALNFVNYTLMDENDDQASVIDNACFGSSHQVPVSHIDEPFMVDFVS
jgi:hypothetical protein